MLEAALVRGLTEGGIDVVLIGMGPSPMLYFATHYLDVDGGIQVTGSHNPADYNGFKLLLKGRSVFGAGDPGDRPARRRRPLERRQRNDRGGRHPRSLCDRLLEGFSGKPYRIGWDAGNGAAGPILDMLVDRLPGQHHVIFSERRRDLPEPPSRSDGREEPRGPQALVERESSTSALPSTATATASARSTARAG